MKFTKDDAYKELVRQMTANGEKLNLSDRSINEQLEKLIPLIASDETELNVFIESTLPFFKTADANVRNDVSVGIKEYKENNPINPKPKEETHEEKHEEPNDFEARLAALEAENNAQKEVIRVQKIKEALISKMKEKGIKNDKWINTMVGNINISGDFDVDANADNYLELYNSMMADYNPNATPKQAGSGKDEYTSDVIKAASEMTKMQNLVGID